MVNSTSMSHLSDMSNDSQPSLQEPQGFFALRMILWERKKRNSRPLRFMRGTLKKTKPFLHTFFVEKKNPSGNKKVGTFVKTEDDATLSLILKGKRRKVASLLKKRSSSVFWTFFNKNLFRKY